MRFIELSALLGFVALAGAAPSSKNFKVKSTTYTCPDQFNLYGTYCYYYSNTTEMLQWSDAGDACVGLNANAHLARPTDAEIDQFIQLNIDKTGVDFWFDLNDISKENHFEYTNGDAVDYTDWARGEPDNGGLLCPFCQQDCVKYSEKESYLWDDEDCSNQYRFVCQVDATAITSSPDPNAPTTPAPPCPDSFSQYGTSCYYYSDSADTLEWSDAGDACVGLNANAHLARPIDAEIDNFIQMNIEDTGDDFWFDLNDQSKENDFEYTNGDPVNYTDWGKGEPDNGGLFCPLCQQDCVKYSKKLDYLWDDEECKNKYRYVCQLDI